jgi:hypothetical protein
LVKSDIAAEKRRVKTMRTPTASTTALGLDEVVRRYMAMMGRTSRTKMTNVMRMPTNLSIREEE